MEELHLPNNIKVHFAGCEVQNQYVAVRGSGINYALYTAFPFVEKMLFEHPKHPIMPLVWQKENPEKLIPQYIMQSEKHVIQDSGLFTLMFGSNAGTKDEKLISKWYDALVRYTNDNTQGVICVEVDCQKVLGVEQAWEFRQRMRNELPNNRIINVFHLEDGQYGLDRMIEFSDYIAISVPELRKAGKKEYVPKLAKYIKSRKPNIDIHLLGCTELALLKQCTFCTSCDSTTYTGGKRYGFLKGRHISRIKTDAIQKHFGMKLWKEVNEYNKKEYNTNQLLLQIEICKNEYQNAAGEQDYKR